MILGQIFICCAGGQGRVIRDMVSGKMAFTMLDDNDENCYPIDALKSLYRKDDGVIVALGDNYKRYEMVQRIKAMIPEVEFATIVHRSAVIGEDVLIGEGSVVMAGAIVGTGSKIGEHCIINTKASIDHDGAMGDYTSLAPGSTCGGHVGICTFSHVGIGANVLQDLWIGENCILGSGATLTKNIDAIGEVWMCTPAEFVKGRKLGEPYL